MNQWIKRPGSRFVEPRTEGPAVRVREFFDRNPAEFLTMGDIQAKFDLTLAQARAAVARAVRDGRIEASYMYRKGRGK